VSNKANFEGDKQPLVWYLQLLDGNWEANLHNVFSAVSIPSG